MDEDLLTTLRTRTRPAHAALEQAGSLKVLLQGEVELDDYRRALERLLAFHVWVEDRLADSATDPETVAGVPGRLLAGGRAEDLRSDLAAIGAPVGAPREGSTGRGSPASPSRPGATVLADALGILYVSEGSRLGGAVIGRHLAGALGLERERGLRFFLGGSQDEASRRWREVCALLASHGGRGATFTERVAVAAEACFEVARRCLVEERP